MSLEKNAAALLSPDAADAIASLHTRTVDALAGYDKMAEKAVAEFKGIVADFQTLHQRHAAALSSMLSSAGRDPSGSGSIMGTINHAVVAIRSVFDDIDSDVIENILSGEEYITAAFDDVLAEDLPPPLAQKIAGMSDELDALLDRVSALA